MSEEKNDKIPSSSPSIEKTTCKKKKKNNRCCVCRKKNLTNLICKCGKVVCLTHRYESSHECNFNWKQQGRKILHEQLKFEPPPKIEVV